MYKYEFFKFKKKLFIMEMSFLLMNLLKKMLIGFSMEMDQE